MLLRYKGQDIDLGDIDEAAAFLKKLKKLNSDAARLNYLDELADVKRISTLRKNALLKWQDKFTHLYKHMDGELILQRISRKDGRQILNGSGGHNYHAEGLNFKIRQYLTQPIDDLPFDALIEVRYSNGIFLPKTSKSTIFPKNWDITRINEEIALVYDKVIALGKSFQHKALDSSGKFWIKIELDKQGNLRNAYPLIN